MINLLALMIRGLTWVTRFDSILLFSSSNIIVFLNPIGHCVIIDTLGHYLFFLMLANSLQFLDLRMSIREVLPKNSNRESFDFLWLTASILSSHPGFSKTFIKRSDTVDLNSGCNRYRIRSSYSLIQLLLSVHKKNFERYSLLFPAILISSQILSVLAIKLLDLANFVGRLIVHISMQGFRVLHRHFSSVKHTVIISNYFLIMNCSIEYQK